MEKITSNDTLHTGLLTLDRKHLISPNGAWPELFTDALDQNGTSSVESQARWALGTRGIMASTERILLPHAVHPHRGYLLREASRIDIESHGLTTYTHDEVEAFAHSRDENDISIHFLRQIARHMRPLR